MQHEVKAPFDCRAVKLLASSGDVIEKDGSLLTITAEELTEQASETIKDAPADIRADLSEILRRKAAGYDENRPDAVAKRRKFGGLTIRESIGALIGGGSFTEIGGLAIAAQRARRSEDDLIANTTGDGLIAGIGQIEGEARPIAIMAHDYSVLAGTQGHMGHMKMDRIIDIARRKQMPMILFAEGGGGRPGDTDGLPIPGLGVSTFTHFAGLSGHVPVIGITSGRCFAGNAVLLGCCDVIIAAKNSNIGIGGPAMVEGGGQGVFTPEEIGPASIQYENGVIDILCDDEPAAIKAAREYLSYCTGGSADWEAPNGDPRALVPEDRKRYFEMREVLESIADSGSFLELRQGFAPGMITGFARMEGRPFAIIANDPVHLAGAIDGPGADKAVRFIDLCERYKLPLLSVIDCPGIMVGPESETTALVRRASDMFVRAAKLTIPHFALVVRKAYGLGAMAMAGGSLKTPLFTAAWPTAEFGAMGLEGAVKLGFRKELAAITDEAARAEKYEEMVAAAYAHGRAANMASYFEVDDVIDPVQTRSWLTACLLATNQT